MNAWISKDGVVYHYHTGHRSICCISDILQDIVETNHTAENPDTKCTICMRILTSKGFFRINQEKNRNNIREAKFLQKYKTSPVHLMIQYLNGPENHAITTIQKIHHELAELFDGININDILAEALVRGDITYANGNFYPKSKGEIIL